MSSPQERQLREQRQKRKHDTRFPNGEEHLHMDGDIYENWMDTIRSPQHFQHYNSICNNNNNKHKEVYRLLDYRWREWKHKLL